MSKHDFKETILPDGRVRWSKENVTIEKHGEHKFWVRVQISKICYSRQATFETWLECETFADKRLDEKEKLGLDSLPKQEEIIALRKLRKSIGNVDLEALGSLWLRHQPEKIKTLWEAIDNYINVHVPKLALTTRFTNTSKAKWLNAQFGKKVLLTDISSESLKNRLAELSVKNVTKNGYLSFIKAFFKWCISEGYLNESPAIGIGDFHEAGRAVKYLKREDAEAFIRCAEKEDPELVPILVLMLFAGIRPDIVRRMAPILDELIDLTEKVITIPAYLEEGLKVNKTADYVIESDLPGDIWGWLAAYWDGGPLRVQNFQKRRRQIAITAGINLSHDVLRHTFATFDYASCRNMAEVAGHLGHSDQRTTAKYYVNRTAKARDARAFFALRPLPGAKPVRRKWVNRYETKTDWPSDALLVAWVEARGKTQVGKQLGVSEAAVRKRLRRNLD